MVGDAWRAGLTVDTFVLGGTEVVVGVHCEEPICHLDSAATEVPVCVRYCADL